ncbi:MAG TPA: DEAD/DEAH box helicase, partial [Acidimicrobiales bacterium]|nr:DEAD/DEAH box helicase [Acidimicrobiales bacterium]
MIEQGRPDTTRTVAAEAEGGVARDLAAVARSLPGGGEERPGQLAMAQAVERALVEDRHLVVQAGTGTGKSLAYLLPVVRSGRKAVVATATKALQDQLAAKDLPQLAAALGGAPVRFAVLKGRANYLCRQRVAEIGGHATPASPAPLFDAGEVSLATAAGDAAPETSADGLDDPDVTDDMGAPGGRVSEAEHMRLVDQVLRLTAWADETSTGDRADLDFEPSPRAWAMVSVTARECPGAFRCPSGPDCFAEHARAKAAAADVVVVNTHLYATHVASDGAVLPEHDVLVFDEAHAVED